MPACPPQEWLSPAPHPPRPSSLKSSESLLDPNISAGLYRHAPRPHFTPWSPQHSTTAWTGSSCTCVFHLPIHCVNFLGLVEQCTTDWVAQRTETFCLSLLNRKFKATVPSEVSLQGPHWLLLATGGSPPRPRCAMAFALQPSCACSAFICPTFP